MKNLLATVVLGIGLIFSLNVQAAAELKEVCHDKVDKKGQPVKGKDGKVQQDCKKIKTHKKLEGTAVPDKAPAKKDEKKK